jgi:hypothetical protein
MEVVKSTDLVGLIMSTPIWFEPILRSPYQLLQNRNHEIGCLSWVGDSLYHGVFMLREQRYCGGLDGCHLGVSHRVGDVEAAREE